MSLAAILLYTLLVSTYPAKAQESPLRLGRAREITSSVSLYKPINLEVGPDGAVFLGDSGSQQIIKLSPEGEVMWRVGREGQGPGEFGLPYEIHRFSHRGELLELIRRDYEFTGGPGGGEVAIPAGERLRYFGPPGFVPHPLGAKDLGDGWLLGGVLTAPDVSIWDLFHDGELVASFPAPNGWLAAVDIDPQRRVLYVKSENGDGDPIYLQVPYTINTSVVRDAIEGRE